MKSLPRLSVQYVALIAFMEILILSIFILPDASALTGQDLHAISVFTTCFFAFNLLLLLQLPQVEFASVPFLFACVLTLYSASSSALFWLNGYDGLAYYRALDSGALAHSSILITIGLAAYVLGVTLGQRKGVIGPASAAAFGGRLEALSRLFSLGIIAICLLVIFVETARGGGLMPMLEDGYHDYSDQRKEGDQSRLFGAAMTWLLPIASLTLTTVQKRRLQRLNWSDGLLIAVMAIPLIAGDRGTFLATLAAWLCVHHAVCKSVKMHKVLIIGAACLVFVPLMQVMRSEPVSNWTPGYVWSTLANLADEDERFAGSGIQMVLGPFSSSQMTMMGTVMRVEGGEPARLGMDYVRGVLAAIPLNSGIAANNSGQIHHYLIPGRAGGPGFMANAEMYINFLVPGIILGHMLMGLALSHIWQRLLDPRTAPYMQAGLAVLIYAMLIWIRNEFTFLAQVMFIWAFCFLFVSALVAPHVPWRRRGLA